MAVDRYYGLASRRIRPRNGLQIRSRKRAAGNKHPHYLIRDRDRAYGETFDRRLRSVGIRDRPTSPHSPWQNGYAERLVGSIRRECVHIVVLGDRHLRHVLLSYMNYYNEMRTHLSLDKDAPVPRTIGTFGHILCRPVLGGYIITTTNLICDRHSLRPEQGSVAYKVSIRSLGVSLPRSTPAKQVRLSAGRLRPSPRACSPTKRPYTGRTAVRTHIADAHSARVL